MSIEEKGDDGRQGIQSIEVGVPLLRVLADHGAPMMLRDLARQAGMPAAKAHRYLVSFVRTGFVVQEAHSGRYDLGPFALELGLASIARLDPVRVATPVLEALAEETGETVALRLENPDGVAHTFTVDELGVDALMPAGKNSLALFKPTKPGTYTFYCIPHYDKASGQGMHGTLVVE